MPATQHLNPELTQQLQRVLEFYFARYHRQKCYIGLSFNQGKRKMIQINVPAEDLPTLLQAKHSIDNNPDSGKNRPEVKGHVEEVKEYVMKRVSKDKPWILGTLTANVDPEKIEVTELSRGICFVVIPRGTKLDITDGQHRKRAIHELVESSQGELIGENDFPITLVLEGDFKQCQMDFRDMAETRQLDKSLLLSFGEFEGKVGIVKSILETVPMLKDKTERISKSPSAKKRLIFTMNYLARFVGCAFTKNPISNLENCDVKNLSESLSSALNLFFSECHQTKHIQDTPHENLTVEDFKNFQDNCVLSKSVGVETLGRLFYEAKNEHDSFFNLSKISQLAQLDWSKKNNLWRGNLVLENQDNSHTYKMSTNSSSVKMAVGVARNALGWV